MRLQSSAKPKLEIVVLNLRGYDATPHSAMGESPPLCCMLVEKEEWKRSEEAAGDVEVGALICPQSQFLSERDPEPGA